MLLSEKLAALDRRLPMLKRVSPVAWWAFAWAILMEAFFRCLAAQHKIETLQTATMALSPPFFLKET